MFISKDKLRKLENAILLQRVELANVEKILSELVGYDITSIPLASIEFQNAAIEHKERPAANLKEKLKKINDKINKK